MNGKELKEILNKEGVNLAELSRKLGYANDQRLHSALNAADVKSGLIEEIANATNKTVGFFYNEANMGKNTLQVSGHHNSADGAIVGDGNNTTASLLTEIDFLREQLRGKDELIKQLQKEKNEYWEIIKKKGI